MQLESEHMSRRSRSIHSHQPGCFSSSHLAPTAAALWACSVSVKAISSIPNLPLLQVQNLCAQRQMPVRRLGLDEDLERRVTRGVRWHRTDPSIMVTQADELTSSFAQEHLGCGPLDHCNPLVAADLLRLDQLVEGVAQHIRAAGGADHG